MERPDQYKLPCTKGQKVCIIDNICRSSLQPWPIWRSVSGGIRPHFILALFPGFQACFVTSNNKMVNDSISGKPKRNSPMKNTKKLEANYT